MTTKDNQKRYTLRMDLKIFNEVEKRATEYKRSIAKEIEFCIEQYLKNLK